MACCYSRFALSFALGIVALRCLSGFFPPLFSDFFQLHTPPQKKKNLSAPDQRIPSNFPCFAGPLPRYDFVSSPPTILFFPAHVKRFQHYFYFTNGVLPHSSFCSLPAELGVHASSSLLPPVSASLPHSPSVVSNTHFFFFISSF